MYTHSSHTSTFTSYAQYKWVIVCRGRPACTMMCVVLPLKQLAIRPPYFLTRIWAWLYDKRKADDSMKLHFIIICNLDSTNKCTVKPLSSGLLTLFLCTTFGHTKLISCSWSAGYRCMACAFSMQPQCLHSLHPVASPSPRMLSRLVPRPNPLMRRNGLVNKLNFLG